MIIITITMIIFITINATITTTYYYHYHILVIIIPLHSTCFQRAFKRIGQVCAGHVSARHCGSLGPHHRLYQWLRVSPKREQFALTWCVNQGFLSTELSGLISKVLTLTHHFCSQFGFSQIVTPISAFGHTKQRRIPTLFARYVLYFLPPMGDGTLLSAERPYVVACNYVTRFCVADNGGLLETLVIMAVLQCKIETYSILWGAKTPPSNSHNRDWYFFWVGDPY